MTFEQAKELSRGIESDTIIVLSDGSIYLSADTTVIEDHANKEGLEIFRIRPEVLPITKPKKK
jgi:hypothetical protein